MWGKKKAARKALIGMGSAVNEGVSMLVFTMLDLLDRVLCWVYRVVDWVIEATEGKGCYCYCGSSREAMTRSASGKILVSEKGQSVKIVRLTCSSTHQLHLDDVSDTLFCRPSLLSDFLRHPLPPRFKRLLLFLLLDPHHNTVSSLPKKLTTTSASASASDPKKIGGTAFTVNSTIVEMLQGKIGSLPIPRWSDCDCSTCTSWLSSSNDSLFVHVDGATGQGGRDHKGKEDVVFIHGFISSSKFWTETVFPNFTGETKSKYRLFAVDLLGFGRSPKPTDSLYTLKEHVDMIERSVLDAHCVKSFHIVAHSLGCILAFALAVRHPSQIKSLTLIAPPYFPVPKGEQGTQYVLRRVAPRRVWPPIVLGASIVCWYEHISRTICLLICKNHRLWEFLTKLFTRNRMRTFLMEGFFCHTHNAAWHTLHNIICGAAGKLDNYMDTVRDRLKCNVTIFHGRDDELLPVECSLNVKSRIPRAQVKVVDNKDHLTIVVGRQQAFARELEAIWTKGEQRNLKISISDFSKRYPN